MLTKAALSLTLSSSLCLSPVPSSRAISFKRVGIKSIEMMSCDFKSIAYLSHRLKGSWIKNHAITIHAGYGLRVQFSEHICVLRAIFPTILKKRSKVNASFLKGDSSAVSEEVFKRACNKIPKTKRHVKETWMKCIFFKINVWNAHNLISATPGQKKKNGPKVIWSWTVKGCVADGCDSEVLTSSAEVIIRAKYMYFQFKGTAYQIEWSL